MHRGNFFFITPNRYGSVPFFSPLVMALCSYATITMIRKNASQHLRGSGLKFPILRSYQGYQFYLIVFGIDVLQATIAFNRWP